MPATRRGRCRLFMGLFGVCWVVVQLGAAGVAVAAPAAQAYVKYYTVAASYQGSPENLTEIAARLLGSGERSADIYNLNAGRVQPDGTGLTDPAVLHAGWALVLPWDAAGDGVKIGQLPGVAPPQPATAPPRPAPSTSRAGPSRPPPSTRPPGTGSPTRCAGMTASSKQSDWAQTRMAPDLAWDRTRGGVMVAVIDSGVDSRLPQLSGRVAVGADITSGKGRGDLDCIGSGTAMAGLVAAGADQDGGPAGIAPDATILPIRVVTTGTEARSADVATGIEVAVSAGASVVAMGSFADVTDPAVAEAIRNVLSHDVLVVLAAPTAPVALPSPDGGSGAGALLSVGGVGADNQVAAAYQESTVDVVAPGIDVATIGLTGRTVTNSGSQYAVAFAAGQAALVRAAFPQLTAAQVKERIEATADRLGPAAPDQRYGWGMINPSSAVTATVADERRAAVVQRGGGGGTIRTVTILAAVVILLGAVTVLVVRSRRHTDDGYDE